MLTQICQELRNWFTWPDDKIFGAFKIVDGTLTPSINLHPDQYFRVIGSMYNDGVHKFGDADLKDEEFDGSVWKMMIPTDVISLANEINTYITSNGAVSPYSSESFGGYSYTRQFNDWQSAFASKLNRWRKI